MIHIFKKIDYTYITGKRCLKSVFSGGILLMTAGNPHSKKFPIGIVNWIKPFIQRALAIVPEVDKASEEDILRYWRRQISRALSLCFVYLGGITLFFSAPLLLQRQHWGMLFLDIGGIVMGWYVSLNQKVSYKARTMVQLAVIHLIGVGLQISVDVPRGGLLWFFTFSVLAGILLGVRAAVVATLINVLSMIWIGVCLAAGWLSNTAMASYDISSWFVTIVNFLALNSATAILASLVLRGLQESVEREKLARQQLMIEQENLLETNRRLLQEMDNRRRVEERLKHMASTDALTGLPNRMLFIDRLDHAVALAKRNQTRLAVLFIDLDDFKSVNDAFNHQHGDDLLRVVARSLTASIRSSDTVARMSGDEFCVLLEGIVDEECVLPVVEKIRHSISEPIQIIESIVYVTSSIGVAIYPENGETSRDLLQNADTAMYRAKARGKNTYQFFTEELAFRSLERLELLAQLRLSLSKGDLRLYFQPIYDVQTGRVAGAEALLRWAHPERGILLPGIFLDIADEGGMMPEIGNWVLHETSRCIRRWSEDGLSDVFISLNISGKQLDRQNILALTRRLILDEGLDPHGLQLEITENSLLREFEETRSLLEELKSLGFGLALDDFGTGYSSLNYLARYPFDTIKIDRSFVRNVDSDSGLAAIVHGIIAIGQSLNLTVVAEGIETQEQYSRFVQMGCHLVQGWYFNPALPENEWIELLKKERVG